MLSQIEDFRAEADDLHGLLATVRDTDWEQATLFKQWTVNDIIRHLHDGDRMAAASLAGPEHFTNYRAERRALLDRGLSGVEATRQHLGGLAGTHLLERWYAGMDGLCRELAALPPETRLKWAGPDMGVRMFTTARQMETWAHAQAIFDVLGRSRTPTDRLRNVAEIGVRTYGWTFANRGREVPGPAPFVRLTGPSGALWQWNQSAPDNMIEGDAAAFCQVVTQTRNIADTDLKVIGEPARIWMSLAQCFAGPPEDPPAPGLRRAAGGN